MNIYSLAASKADEIEAELKRLGRWMPNSLPEEYFTNMGTFGSNTMGFEQWLQFVLLPRIREIVEEKDDFPSGSNLAPYAIRYFDGDNDTKPLHDMLYKLDKLIDNQELIVNPIKQSVSTPPPTVTLGDTTIPSVIYSIAEGLPQFKLNDLESQLQTFDTFLDILSPTARPTISTLLKNAAEQIVNPDCKKRIEKAAADVAEGRRAAPPYHYG